MKNIQWIDFETKSYFSGKDIENQSSSLTEGYAETKNVLKSFWGYDCYHFAIVVMNEH